MSAALRSEKQMGPSETTSHVSNSWRLVSACPDKPMTLATSSAWRGSQRGGCSAPRCTAAADRTCKPPPLLRRTASVTPAVAAASNRHGAARIQRTCCMNMCQSTFGCSSKSLVRYSLRSWLLELE
eukprot:CAMPEP_0172825170 /NCGR_PEP_ID=MMETSP1075-20121228/18477_1 /TAXON_ID=2916 /ORGANISM="Ceratium fusus, Strain PA161109" /LENGTH=125 /DNA_ID=CAMNT_0013666565 /DNA_START=931 /DNA_END=1305 /DNA_ORIENTATION=+